MKRGLKTTDSDILGGSHKSFPFVISLAIPGVLLIGAYIHMSLSYEKVWLFNTIVHENGKYTLFEVIFYFRHFLWEAPMKALYSLFIIGAFYSYGNHSVKTYETGGFGIPVERILIGGCLAFGVVLFAVIMSANQVGFKDTLMGLFQYRTHELRPVEFGSHWRNHFLSNIVLFSATALCILFYRMVSCNGFWVKRRFSAMLPFSAAIFILLTLLFGFTMDPFETPSYLGHQLREIFGSDVSITMFLSMGVLIYLERKYDMGKSVGGIEAQRDNRKNILHMVCWSVPITFITGFLVVKVLNLDIGANIETLGHTKGWSVWDLFAWHFFEHSLDYIFVVSLVYTFYLMTLKIEIRRIAK